MIFQSRSDIETADSIYCEALAVERAVLGERHPDVAFTLEGLGILATASTKPIACCASATSRSPPRPTPIGAARPTSWSS